MTESCLDYVGADRTSLVGSFGRGGARNVACLVLYVSAYRALVPVLVFAFRPRGLVAVSYGARVAANITGRIASIIVSVRGYTALSAGVAGRIARVVKVVSCLVFLNVANRALVPVTVLIFRPCSVVGMCYRANITAGVTSGVAGVVVNVLAVIFFVTATCAGVPVCVSVKGPIVAVSVRVSQCGLDYILTYRTYLCGVFGCGCTGYVACLVIFITADRALVPVVICIA